MSPRRPGRALIVATAAGALLAAAAPAGGRAPAWSAAATPRLTLTALKPPTVDGSSFANGEYVTITLRGLPGGTRVRHRRTGPAGTFRVVFRKAKAGRCDGFTVRATGDAGSRATLRRIQLPACSAG